MSNASGIWITLRQALAWWFLIFVWESMSIPMSSHSNSWQGIWLSLAAIPVSAYFLSRHLSRSALFVYGVATAALFVSRFLHMDRFRLWLQFVAPPLPIIVLWWVAIALLLGFACFIAASIQRTFAVRVGTKDADASASDDAEPRSTLPIGRYAGLWICLFMAFFAVTVYLSQQRSFLGYLVQWPRLGLTGVRAAGNAVNLTALVAFLFGAEGIRQSFVSPGGALLLAQAAATIYRLVAIVVLVVTSQAVTIGPNWDGYVAVDLAGSICSALILVPHLKSSRAWRFPLGLTFLSLLLSSTFAGGGGSSAAIVRSAVLGASTISLVVRSFTDWRRIELPRTHWIGVGAHLAMTALDVAPRLPIFS